MSSKIIPQHQQQQKIVLFQGNRKQKRHYAPSTQDKIVVDQIFSINDLQKQLHSGSLIAQSLSTVVMGPTESFAIGLTSIGQVYIWGDFVAPIPSDDFLSQPKESIEQPGNIANKIQNITNNLLICQQIPQHLTYFKNVKISVIACTDQIALFLSNEGTMYVWGDDSEQKFGILGLGNQYKAMRPCPNSQLFDYMIKAISLAETHACAVDSNGRLFCWGYGPHGELGLPESQQNSANIPTIVSKQKQINVKKAIAHTSYTAFCSGAGYLFLFGSLQTSLKEIHSSHNRASLTQSVNGAQNMLPLQKSYTQMNFENAKRNNNPLTQSTNRPLNSMTQVINLSENFISDVIGGDNYLIASTAQGEIFFVDDSLESVQLNTTPIESVAVAGSKILGICKQGKIYEWSTAGLNKLSFNKENKLLLRQDFQLREYKLKEEFMQGFKLQSLNMTKVSAALAFYDTNNKVYEKFSKGKSQIDHDDEPLQLAAIQSQIILAEIVQNTSKLQNYHYNPMISDSSMSASNDQLQIEQDNNTMPPQQLQQQQKEQTQQVKNDVNDSTSSFQNNSIVQEDFLGNTMDDFNRLGQISSQKLEGEETTHYDMMALRQSQQISQSENIFNYTGLNQQNQTQQQQQTPKQQEAAPINPFSIIKQESQAVNIIQQPNQFFFDNDLPILPQTTTMLQSYRPSSIKSNKKSCIKSQSSFNNQSSSSLKQCAADMMPFDQNSKVETSFPSFLNMSGDNPYAHIHLQKNSTSLEQSPIIKQSDQKSQNQQQSNNRYDFTIKYSTQSRNLTPKSSQSATSHFKGEMEENKQEQQELEHQFHIKIDSCNENKKKQTSPRRLLTSYCRSKRSEISPLTPSENNYLLSKQKQRPPIEGNVDNYQSELSQEFDLTMQTHNQQENYISTRIADNKMTFGTKIGQQVNNEEQDHLQEPEQETYKKQSNSCRQNRSAKTRNQQLLQRVTYSQQRPSFDFDMNHIGIGIKNFVNPFNTQQKDQEMANIGTEEEFLLEQIKVLEQPNLDSSDSLQQSSDEDQEEQQPEYVEIEEQMQRQTLFDQMQQQPATTRESFGNNQTDFEVEYSISNSCFSPQSNNPSEKNIKRKINFNDVSQENKVSSRGETIIRFSDKFVGAPSFTLTINPRQPQLESIQQNSQLKATSSNPYLLQNNESSSFLFNQCQSPTPALHPFHESTSLGSNIKQQSLSPNNTTHIIMMTEEKFKNLKSEISQSEQNQLQYTNNNPNSLANITSPLVTDINRIQKQDSRSLLLTTTTNQQSNIQNLSSFIQHSKYLQIYENFRRGFQILVKVKDSTKLQAFEHIKNICKLEKLRSQKLAFLAKILFKTLKSHIQNQKQQSLKSIKKIYKERQLQVYIKRKQNEFALKSSILVKIDTIISNKNNENISSMFAIMKNSYTKIKKDNDEKKRKALNQLCILLNRKNKFVKEKSLRTIGNWVNSKKILEINMKMLARGIAKIFQSHKRKQFYKLLENLKLVSKLRKVADTIQLFKINDAFLRYKQLIQQKNSKQQAVKLMIGMNIQIHNRLNQIQCIQLWKNLCRKQATLVQVLRKLIGKALKQKTQQVLSLLKQNVQGAKKKQKVRKLQKALLLMLFSRLDQMIRRNYIAALKNIKQISYERSETDNLMEDGDDTLFINKSQTQGAGNMSFLQNEPSLILTRKQQYQQQLTITSPYYSTENFKAPLGSGAGAASSQGGDRSLLFAKNAAAALGNVSSNSNYYYGGSGAAGQQPTKRDYLTVQNGNQDKPKTKPTLNDYLSFSPHNQDSSKLMNKSLNTTNGGKQGNGQQKIQQQDKLQKQYNTERNATTMTGIAHKRPIGKGIVIEKSSYLEDCPPMLPLQMQSNEKNKQRRMQQQKQQFQQQQFGQTDENFNNQNDQQNEKFEDQILDVSIKDMNKAFKDQVSRIKDQSYLESSKKIDKSSSQNEDDVNEDRIRRQRSSSQKEVCQLNSCSNSSYFTQNSALTVPLTIGPFQAQAIKDQRRTSEKKTQSSHKNKHLEIEVSQTPEQFKTSNYNQQLFQQQELESSSDNDSQEGKPIVLEKRTSPGSINPLCTSESYYIAPTLQQTIINNNEQEFHVKQGVSQGKVHTQQHLHFKLPKLEQLNTGIAPDLPSGCSVPLTSTFGGYLNKSQNRIDNEQNSHCHLDDQEEVEEMEEEESLSQFIDQNNGDNILPMTFRELNSNYQQQQENPAQQTQKKKEDSRYRRVSMMDNDFSMDLEQQHGIFDEFDHDQHEQQIINRMQSSNNLGVSQVKSSIADLSRHLTNVSGTHRHEKYYFNDGFDAQGEEDQSSAHNLTNSMQLYNQFNTNSNIMNVNKSQPLKNSAGPVPPLPRFSQTTQQQQTKTFQTAQLRGSSPKFSENLAPFNLRQFNEMAANFQMLELTPDADFQMLLNNKSSAYPHNKQNQAGKHKAQNESVYSNNYADPVEMTLSPRALAEPNLMNNYQVDNMREEVVGFGDGIVGVNTIPTQVNFYSGTTESMKSDSYRDELQDDINQLINNEDHQQQKQDKMVSNKPQDLQMSGSGGRQQEMPISNRNILPAQQPASMIMQHNQNICKKLSFGTDNAKQQYNSHQHLQQQQPQQLHYRNASLTLASGEVVVDLSSKAHQINMQQLGATSKNQHNTLLGSCGEQTINFNLTQEEGEGEDEIEDDEGDVGSTDEIPIIEDRCKQVVRNLPVLPESKIHHQELQEEKSSHHHHLVTNFSDFAQTANNRLEQLNTYSQNYQPQQQQLQNDSLNQFKYRLHSNSQRDQPRVSKNKDFIQQNIEKLKNMVRLSPRYGYMSNQAENTTPIEATTSMQTEGNQRQNSSSRGNSTRNVNQRGFGYFNSRQRPQQQLQQQLQNQSNTQNKSIGGVNALDQSSQGTATAQGMGGGVTRSYQAFNKGAFTNQSNNNGGVQRGELGISKQGGPNSNSNSYVLSTSQQQQQPRVASKENTFRPSVTSTNTSQQLQSSRGGITATSRDSSLNTMRQSANNVRQQQQQYIPMSQRGPLNNIPENSNISSTTNQCNTNLEQRRPSACEQLNYQGSTNSSSKGLFSNHRVSVNKLPQQQQQQQQQYHQQQQQQVQTIGLKSSRSNNTNANNNTNNSNIGNKNEKLHTFLTNGNKGIQQLQPQSQQQQQQQLGQRAKNAGNDSTQNNNNSNSSQYHYIGQQSARTGSVNLRQFQ